jgi:cysteine synthase
MTTPDLVTDAIGYASSTAQERATKNPDMALWWSRFQNIVNPERHEIYGATLTPSEQESWA